MSIGLRLDLRQSQQLVMTPQLQQAIKLLQMSNVELASFVDSEIEKNPILRVETNAEPTAERPVAEPQAPTAADGAPAAADQRTDDHALAADTFDTGTENLHDAPRVDTEGSFSKSASLRSGGIAASDEGWSGLEERLAERPSLKDHLRSQLGQERGDPTTIQVARYLVDELDEHGYLRVDLGEVAERIGIAPEIVEQALTLVQACEPTGVGARNVGECLALQLKEQNRLDPAIGMLLDNLELLATGDRRRLRTLCRLDDDEISEMVQEIRTLDPRPCASFDCDEPETLIPDVLLRRTDWGGWHIELNPQTLPRVLIDRTYAAEIRSSDCPDARQFLSECQSTASWLIKSLDQRAKTIVKIATEIVRQQERFFQQGITGLRPMTLRDVADAVGMHESTASRVTANKYIATDRGIFELKFFFTNAVGGGDGDIAAEAVRHRIKTMVDREDPNAVLSDDAIVDALCKDGIEIARRTIAKYRKSLNIPSSVERRRQKAVRASL